MVKNLKVGVYRLVFRGKPITTLVKIVEAIKLLPPDESRTAMIIDDPIRPRDDIRINKQYCLVDFNRIRPTDHILTADTLGNEGLIKFGRKAKRPCQRTVVLLDQHSNIMYIHEGWGSAGIGHNTMAKYLRAVGELEAVAVEVVLHDIDALERLRDKRHKVFRVRIAGVENAEVLRAQGLGDEAILRTLRAFRSPNANIGVGLEKGDPGQLDNVLETAAALIGWNNMPEIFGTKKPVKYIAIEPEGEEHEVLVNLLEDRMRHAEKVELEPGTEPSDAERYRAVVKAFERFSPDLRRRYPV